MEKSPQALALIAGVFRQASSLPLNTGYTVDELRYFIENSGAKLVVCDAAKSGQIETIGVPVATLNADGTGSLSEPKILTTLKP